jgi:hypothetical protein
MRAKSVTKQLDDSLMVARRCLWQGEEKTPAQR